MLADTDAGNVVTAAQAGAQWGYRLLPLILALAPALYMVQELAARLGVFTGRGFGELIRERLGDAWALAGAGRAGRRDLRHAGHRIYRRRRHWRTLRGVARRHACRFACAVLLAVAATGSYRRVERIALAIGLFEGAFLLVAWRARPDPLTRSRDAIRCAARRQEISCSSPPR